MQNLLTKTRWLNVDRFRLACRPHGYRPGVILTRTSLTQELRAVLDDRLRVRVIGQHRAFLPDPLFPSQRQAALLRETLLCDEDAPWVFAQSQLFYNALHGRWGRLKRWRSGPLGDFLFGRGNATRADTRFSLAEQHTELGRYIEQRTGISRLVYPIRSSLFCLHGRYLVVTEVFLHSW